MIKLFKRGCNLLATNRPDERFLGAKRDYVSSEHQKTPRWAILATNLVELPDTASGSELPLDIILHA